MLFPFLLLLLLFSFLFFIFFPSDKLDKYRQGENAQEHRGCARAAPKSYNWKFKY
jgi:hypothetical protein